MIKRLLLLSIVLTSLFSCSSKENNNRGYIVKVGDLAPDFNTTLEDGKSFQLSDHRGKVVMLQFTASWCGVCRKEMPFIENEIWKVHQDEDFIVVGIDRDEPLEKLMELKKATGISYPLALDPEANIFSLYALKKAGVTRNVIVDKEGKIAYLTRLFNKEEFDLMKKKIEELLKN